jgi:hypothetical protein
MPASTPRLPARSAPTLTCFTGAIAQRDGAQVLGSSYAREWDSTPGAVERAWREEAARLPEPEAGPARSVPGVVPPRPAASREGRPSARAPLAPARRGREREPDLRARGKALPRKEALPWRAACAFAIGAALSALGGLAMDRAGVELAALACAVAGGITLAAGLSGRR